MPVTASVLVVLNAASATLTILRLVVALPTDTWLVAVVTEPAPSATALPWLALAWAPSATALPEPSVTALWPMAMPAS
ncbi:hypothetical protein D9M72_642500 [compost metagenome]